jgi:hypothetical protein
MGGSVPVESFPTEHTPGARPGEWALLVPFQHITVDARRSVARRPL